jgi:hypothetical protein
MIARPARGSSSPTRGGQEGASALIGAERSQTCAQHARARYGQSIRCASSATERSISVLRSIGS